MSCVNLPSVPLLASRCIQCPGYRCRPMQYKTATRYTIPCCAVLHVMRQTVKIEISCTAADPPVCRENRLQSPCVA